MKRRLAVVATSLALLAVVGVGSAQADAGISVPRDDTNGCVLIKPLALAVCIPRF